MSKNHESVNHNNSGLLNNSEPVFLAVAKIFKPHGLKGEVSAEIFSKNADKLITGKEIYIGEKHIPSKVNKIRKGNKKFLISFLDHPKIEDVEFFRNTYIYVKEDKLPVLPGGEYYFHDLIGLEVFSTNNECLGSISDILRTGANDVYVVQPHDQQNEEILLPAIKEVIKKVDIQAKKMIVKLQEWR